MDISQITFDIDMENVTISEEHSAYLTNMFIKSESFVYPHIKYKALPAMIFRWLLKQIGSIGNSCNYNKPLIQRYFLAT